MNQRRLPWLTAVLLGLSALASAQDRVKPEGSGKPMLADVIDIAPWGHIGPEGQPVGVYASLFKRLSDLSACPLEQRLTPIPRAVTEVTRNVAQATIMLDRADLNAGAVELGEVTRLQIEVWLPNGSTLRSLDDLVGKTVGVLRGPTYHEAFDRDPRIKKIPVTSPINQLEMLSKGRLDAAIGVRENFISAMGSTSLRFETFASPIVLEQRKVKLWVSTSMRDTPCAVRLAKALTEVRRNGEVDKMLRDIISYSPGESLKAK
jgi:hypothetical protein